ncbi:type II secretion system F family protein [Gemmata sp.]|uniref:type II secretion system F family protein n=1 Tax=Gemmata sp. TaxID=1914242 RepID=UPI003F6F5AB2
MTTYLVAGLVWGAVVAGIVGLAPLVARLWATPGARVRKRVKQEFGRPEPDQALAAFKDLHKVAAGPAADGPPTPRVRFAAMVERSGLGVSPGAALRLVLVCAGALGAAAGLAKQSVLFGAAGAALGAALPLLYVRYRAKQRDQKLLAQLPGVLDMVARFLRSGHSLGQALGTVSEELKWPGQALFARYVSQRDLGLPLEVTLRELAYRAGLTEYRIMTMAILVQQQTGGNLAEVCERIAAVVRERFRVQGMIRALTAEGRLQAGILVGLCPTIVAVMTLIKPDYAGAMLSQPQLLAGIVVSQAIGILWIRKIVDVKF